MFEVLINAFKIATSPEVVEGTKALVDLFRESPEWQKSICTIQANVTVTDQERVHLLRDLVAEKMLSLQFEDDAIYAFGVTMSELSSNAFQHSGARKKDVVGIVLDTCPAYVSVIIANPSHVRVELDKWIASARDRLFEDPFRTRGRGLILAFEVADELRQSGENSIKAIIYRDAVHIQEIEIDGVQIVHLLSGLTNPSWPRRIIDRLKKITADDLILVLGDVNGLKEVIRSRNLAVAERIHRARTSSENIPTTVVAQLLPTFKTHRGNWRIVTGSRGLEELLPAAIVSSDFESAVRQLSGRRQLDAYVKRLNP